MGTRPNGDIVHRELDTDRSEPVVQIAEIVAELEGTDADELATHGSSKRRTESPTPPPGTSATVRPR